MRSHGFDFVRKRQISKKCGDQIAPFKNVTFSPSADCLIAVDSKNRLFIGDPSLDDLICCLDLGSTKTNVEYVHSHDCLVINDGRTLNIRRDLAGTFLLKSALQQKFPHQDIHDEAEIELELTFTEAKKLLELLNLPFAGPRLKKLPHFCDHLKKELENTEKVTSNSRKLRKWSTIKIWVPYKHTRDVLAELSNDLKCLGPQVDQRLLLPLATALLERLNLLEVQPYKFELILDGAGLDKRPLVSEAARRLTMRNWPHKDYKFSSAEKMAEAGFYHQPNGLGDDRVSCFACNTCLLSWEPNDEPWFEHERHMPSCPFVNDECTGNVPINVTYASGAAIDHGAQSEIKCTGTLSECDWLATSTENGEVVLWNIAQSLKKSDVFSLNSISQLFPIDGSALKTECKADEAKISHVNWADHQNKFLSFFSNKPKHEGFMPNFSAQSSSERVADSSRPYGVRVTAVKVTALCTAGCPDELKSRKGGSGRKVEPCLIVGCDQYETHQMEAGIHQSNSSGNLHVVNTAHSDPRCTPCILVYRIEEDTADSSLQQNSAFSNMTSPTYAQKFQKSVGLASGQENSFQASHQNTSTTKQKFGDEEKEEKSNPTGGTKAIYDGASSSGKVQWNMQDVDSMYDQCMKICDEMGCIPEEAPQYVDSNDFYDEYSSQYSQSSAYAYELFDATLDDCIVTALQDAPSFGQPALFAQLNEFSGDPNNNNQNNAEALGPAIQATSVDLLYDTASQSDAKGISAVDVPSLLGSDVVDAFSASAFDDYVDDPSKMGVASNGPLVKLVPWQKLRLPDTMDTADYYVHSIKPSSHGLGVYVVINSKRGSYGQSDGEKSCAILWYNLALKNDVALCLNEKPSKILHLAPSQVYSSNIHSLLVWSPKNRKNSESEIPNGLEPSDTLILLTENGGLLSVDFSQGSVGSKFSNFDNISNDESERKFTAVTHLTGYNFAAATACGKIYVLELKSLDEEKSQDHMNQDTAPKSSDFSESDQWADLSVNFENIQRLKQSIELVPLPADQWTVRAPSCWSAARQCQKINKNLVPSFLNRKIAKCWRLKADGDTWREHLFEMDFDTDEPIDHLDMKFVLRQAQSISDNVQVALLCQSPRTALPNQNDPKGILAGNSVYTEVFLNSLNSQIACNSLGLFDSLDACQLTGLIQFSCPELIDMRCKKFYGHIYALFDEFRSSDENDQNKANDDKFLTYSKSMPKIFAPVKITKDLISKCYQTLNRHSYVNLPAAKEKQKGCDVIMEISMIAWKSSLTSFDDRRTRELALKSQNLHRQLIEFLCDGEKSVPNNVRLTILDILCRAIHTRHLNNRAVLFNIVDVVSTNVDQLLHVIYASESRSVARKFTFFLASLKSCIELEQCGLRLGTFYDLLKAAFLRCTEEILAACQSSGPLLWYLVLLGQCYKWANQRPDEITACLSHFLVKLGQNWTKKQNNLQKLLAKKYKLFGRPFELQIFEYPLPNLFPSPKPAHPYSYAGAATRGTSKTLNLSNQYEEDDAHWTDFVGLQREMEKNAEGSTSIPSIIGRENFYGLLEVEPLRFSVQDASAGLRVENCAAYPMCGNPTENAATSSSFGHTAPGGQPGVVASTETPSSMLGPLFEGFLQPNVSSYPGQPQMAIFPTVQFSSLNPSMNVSQEHMQQLTTANPFLAQIFATVQQQAQIGAIGQNLSGLQQHVVVLNPQKNVLTTAQSSASTFGVPTTPKTTPFMTPTPLSPFQLSPTGSESNFVNLATGQEKIQKLTGQPELGDLPFRGGDEGGMQDGTLDADFISLNILKPPTPKIVVLERMTSVSSTPCACKNSKPTEKTYFYYLPYRTHNDIGTLIIETWLPDQNLDQSCQLVHDKQIINKCLVVCDLQPPVLCQFLRITYVGKYGLGACSSRVPLGMFFGHAYSDPLRGSAHLQQTPAVDQQKGKKQSPWNGPLSQLLDALLCRYDSACSRLKTSLSTGGQLAQLDEATVFPDGRTVASYRIRELYVECMRLKVQCNVVRRVIDRSNDATDRGATKIFTCPGLSADDQSERVSGSDSKNVDFFSFSADKLRVLSEMSFSCLLGLQENLSHVPNTHGDKNLLDLGAGLRLFECFCLGGTPKLKAYCCTWLLQQNIDCEWWADFFVKILSTFEASMYDDVHVDEILEITSYMAHRLLYKTNDTLTYELVKQLDFLLDQSDNVLLATSVHVVRLISLTLEYYPKLKVVDERWNFSLGEFSRSANCNLSANEKDKKQAEFVCANEGADLYGSPATSMTKHKSCLKKPAVRSNTTGAKDPPSVRLKSALKLPYTLCLSVMKKMARKSFRGDDKSFGSKNFILYVKVLSTLARCSRPMVRFSNLFDAGDTVDKVDLNFFIRNSIFHSNPMIRHASICLIQDFLEVEQFFGKESKILSTIKRSASALSAELDFMLNDESACVNFSRISADHSGAGESKGAQMLRDVAGVDGEAENGQREGSSKVGEFSIIHKAGEECPISFDSEKYDPRAEWGAKKINALVDFLQPKPLEDSKTQFSPDERRMALRFMCRRVILANTHDIPQLMSDMSWLRKLQRLEKICAVVATTFAQYDQLIRERAKTVALPSSVDSPHADLISTTVHQLCPLVPNGTAVADLSPAVFETVTVPQPCPSIANGTVEADPFSPNPSAEIELIDLFKKIDGLCGSLVDESCNASEMANQKSDSPVVEPENISISSLLVDAENLEACSSKAPIGEAVLTIRNPSDQCHHSPQERKLLMSHNFALLPDGRMEQNLGYCQENNVRHWPMIHQATVKCILEASTKKIFPTKRPNTVLAALIKTDKKVFKILPGEKQSAYPLLSRCFDDFFLDVLPCGSCETVERLLHFVLAIVPKNDDVTKPVNATSGKDYNQSNDLISLAFSYESVERLIDWLIGNSSVSERLWLLCFNFLTYVVCSKVNKIGADGTDSAVKNFIHGQKMLKLFSAYFTSESRYISFGRGGPHIAKSFSMLLFGIDSYLYYGNFQKISFNFKDDLISVLSHTLMKCNWNAGDSFPLDVLIKLAEFLDTQSWTSMCLESAHNLVLSYCTALSNFLNSQDQTGHVTGSSDASYISPLHCTRLSTQNLPLEVDQPFNTYVLRSSKTACDWRKMRIDPRDQLLISVAKLINKLLRAKVCVNRSASADAEPTLSPGRRLSRQRPTLIHLATEDRFATDDEFDESSGAFKRRPSLSVALASHDQSNVERCVDFLLASLNLCYLHNAPAGENIGESSVEKLIQSTDDFNVVTVADCVILLLVAMWSRDNAKLIVGRVVNKFFPSISRTAATTDGRCADAESSGPARVEATNFSEPLTAFIRFVLSTDLQARVEFVQSDGMLRLVEKFLATPTYDTHWLPAEINGCSFNEKTAALCRQLCGGSKKVKSQLGSSDDKNAGPNSLAPVGFVEGMQNFGPICHVTSSSPLALNLPALVGIALTKRRTRSANWTYSFSPAESWLDITLTLPYAILLKEILIRPLFSSLQNSPGAIQIELCPDTDVESFQLLGPQIVTAGCLAVRISTSSYDLPVQMVRLHFKRPPDSAILNISQICLLGEYTSSACNANASEKHQLLHLLCYCLQFDNLRFFVKCGKNIVLNDKTLDVRLTGNLIATFLHGRHPRANYKQLVSCLTSLKTAASDFSIFSALLDFLENVYSLTNECEVWLLQLFDKLSDDIPTNSGFFQLLDKLIWFFEQNEKRGKKMSGRILALFTWFVSCKIWQAETSPEFQPRFDILMRLISISRSEQADKIYSCDLNMALNFLASSLCYHSPKTVEILLNDRLSIDVIQKKNIRSKIDKFFYDSLASNSCGLDLLAYAAQSEPAVDFFSRRGHLSTLSALLANLCTDDGFRQIEQISALIDFFCKLSRNAPINGRFLSSGGLPADFYTPLLDYLSRVDYPGDFDRSRYQSLVDNVVELMKNCVTRSFSDNQETIARLIKDLLTKYGLKSFLRNLIIRVVLENQRTVVVVENCRLLNGSVRLTHPEFGFGINQTVKDMPLNKKCHDVLENCLSPFDGEFAGNGPIREPAPLCPLPQNNASLLQHTGKAPAELGDPKAVTKNSALHPSSLLVCCPEVSNEHNLPSGLTVGQLLTHLQKTRSHGSNPSSPRFVRLTVKCGSSSDELDESVKESLLRSTCCPSMLQCFSTVGGLTLLAQYLQFYAGPSVPTCIPAHNAVAPNALSKPEVACFDHTDDESCDEFDSALSSTYPMLGPSAPLPSKFNQAVYQVKNKFGPIDPMDTMYINGVYNKNPLSASSQYSALLVPTIKADAPKPIGSNYRAKPFTKATLSDHVLICFGLFLRLPGYAESLVDHDDLGAQYLLRLCLGVHTNGEEDELLTTENVENLSTLAFEVLSELFERFTWSSEKGRSLRVQCVDLGVLRALLLCLSAFGHQPAKNPAIFCETPKLQIIRALENTLNKYDPAAIPKNVPKPALATCQKAYPAINCLPYSASDPSLFSGVDLSAQPGGGLPMQLPDNVNVQAILEAAQQQVAQTYQQHKKTGTATDKQPEQQGQFWAKGTGFGSGSTQRQWNVDLHVLKQQQDESNVSCILKVLTSFIYPGAESDSLADTFSMAPNSDQQGTSISGAAPPSLDPQLFDAKAVAMIVDSCLVSLLQSYLRNDSMLDISRHAGVYTCVMRALCALALCPQLKPMLFHVDQQQSVRNLLRKLEECVQIYMSKLKPLSKDAEFCDSTKKLNENCAETEIEEGMSKMMPLIKLATSLLRDEDFSANSQVSVFVSGENDQASSSFFPTSAEDHYIQTMKPLQYDSIKFCNENGSLCMPYHYEATLKAAQSQNDRLAPRVRRLAQEIVTLATSLPLSFSSSVFVRCAEERLDTMKVLITGPAGTPYSDGCFEFDAWFPNDYPNSPMHINLQTTGSNTVRFNPNLYNDGKVCLSILNTWHGRPEERWNSHTSSFLQVLVSIQSLIFVPDPYFNEPGFERTRNTPTGQLASKNYDATIRMATVRWAMLEMVRNPPVGFEEMVKTHFWLKRADILRTVESWIADMSSMATLLPAEKCAQKLASVQAFRRYYVCLKEEFSKMKCPTKMQSQGDLKNPSGQPEN